MGKISSIIEIMKKAFTVTLLLFVTVAFVNGTFDVCGEENQILKNAVIKLATTNNSTIGNKYFDDSCSTGEDCPNGHGWCDESGTCQMCSKVCVETIIDAAMTCFDWIHYDDNACAWDIIIEYAVCATCACEILHDILSAIVGHDLDLC